MAEPAEPVDWTAGHAAALDQRRAQFAESLRFYRRLLDEIAKSVGWDRAVAALAVHFGDSDKTRFALCALLAEAIAALPEQS